MGAVTQLLLVAFLSSIWCTYVTTSRVSTATSNDNDNHLVSFTAADRVFQLELRLHNELFGAAYLEHQIDVHNDRLYQQRAASSCIYHGHVTNDDNSRAIVNMCHMQVHGISDTTSGINGINGMTGYIRAFGESYLLEPVGASTATPHRQRGFVESATSSSTPTQRQWWDVTLTRSSLITASLTTVPHRLHRLSSLAMGAVASSTTSITHIHKCGVSPTDDVISSAQSMSINQPTRASANGSPSIFTPLSGPQRYVELLLVNDFGRYTNLTSSTESNTAFAAAIAAELYETASHTTPVVFTNTPIKVVLTSQITFTTRDPYDVTMSSATQTVDADQLLGKFNHWRAVTATSVLGASHDAGHLFSGYTFSNGTTGLAGLGAMCTNSVSGGIEQSLGTNGVYLGVLLAHELGHNLGMLHDGGGAGQSPCPAEPSYLMNPATCLNCDVSFYKFSSCDASSLSNFVNGLTGSMACLDNVPTKVWNATAVCRNGQVEEGEQCDCGESICQNDPCCNGYTCQLIDGKECSATEPCCTNCMFTPATPSTVCRASASACDIAETCSGASGSCPYDMITGDGTPCTTSSSGSHITSTDGHCHAGTCVSYLGSCQRYGYTFDPYGTNFTSCPASEATALNNGNFCDKLLCAKQGVTTGCYGFSLDSTAVKVEDGTSCYSADSKSLDDIYQCYAGICTAAQSINQFVWNISSWSECSFNNCGSRTRTISCSGTAIGYAGVVPFASCSTPVPATTQECDCSSDAGSDSTYYAIGALCVGVLTGLCICGTIYTCNRMRIKRNRRKRAQYATDAAAIGADAVASINTGRGRKKKSGANTGTRSGKKKKSKGKKPGSAAFDDMKDGVANEVLEMGALAPGSEHIVRSPMILRGTLAPSSASSASSSSHHEPPAEEIRLHVATSGMAAPEHRPTNTPSTAAHEEKGPAKRKQRILTPGGSNMGTPSKKSSTPSDQPGAASGGTSTTPSTATFVLRTELNSSPTARRASLPPMASDAPALSPSMTLQGGSLAGPSPKRGSRRSGIGSPNSSKRSTRSPGSKKRGSPKATSTAIATATATDAPSLITPSRRPSLTMGKLPGAIRVAPAAGGASAADATDNFAVNFNT